jgi:iron complex transport system substrate-binding protein
VRFLSLVLACVLTAAAEPQRIVSTAPSITEMLYALGLGDRVQGVTVYCHYPPEATKKTKIGTYLKPDIETILSLRPDLVIVQKNPSDLTSRLTALKLNVLEVDHDSINGIYDSIRRIGEAAGVAERAQSLNRQLKDQLEDVRRRTASLPPQKIMFIVGRTPGTLDGLVAVGKASYLGELMTIAGGVNIFKDSMAPYPKVTHEEILARNPEVIVDMGDMADTVGVTDAHKQSVVALWNRYPNIAAVQQHRVFAVAADIFVVPGPRMVDAARQFSKMLHAGPAK